MVVVVVVGVVAVGVVAAILVVAVGVVAVVVIFGPRGNPASRTQLQAMSSELLLELLLMTLEFLLLVSQSVIFVLLFFIEWFLRMGWSFLVLQN